MTGKTDDTRPRLIDKFAASERTGIPLATFDYWIAHHAIPFVQPAGPRSKAYFSTTLLDRLFQSADGRYLVDDPDFSQPATDSEGDPFGGNVTTWEPGNGNFLGGPVHQSRRAEFQRYMAARAEGATIAEAIAAAEHLTERDIPAEVAEGETGE